MALLHAQLEGRSCPLSGPASRLARQILWHRICFSASQPPPLKGRPMSRLFSFRRRLLAALSFSVLMAGAAHAADPLKVGVLLPGSKTDKGWMESGYDGLAAVQKELGDKIKVQMIENISNADMEQ